MSIVLIDNYDSFTYNLYQMVQSLTDTPVLVFRNDALDFDALLALQPCHIILSPGPGHPSNPRDFGLCRDVILQHDLLNCPVLGVCLGHQGMAYHLGGAVVSAPEIKHGKTSMVRYKLGNPLYDGLSNPFKAMRYHSLMVAEDSAFPDTLTITAREDNQGLIMGIQHQSLPMYGIQFHPESVGTPEGLKLLQNFLEKYHWESQ